MRPNHYCSFLIFIILCAVLRSLHGQGITDSKADKDNRSAIVEVDGYAYLSEDKTIKEIREEALSNAKRMALEQAHTFISSQSKVKNFQLEYDIVISEAEGAVCVLDSKDHGITDDNRYHTWIKAEVTYSLKPPEGKADLSAELVKNPDAPLTVHVWTEKSEYKAGERIRVFLQGNKDFYARVVYRDVQGNLLQMLPNPHRRDNFFRGGKVISIPGKGDRFDLEVGPPFGIENIIVYASSAEMGDADVTAVGNALYSVQDDLKAYGMKTRGVKIVQSEGDRSSGAEFYEAKCEVKTRM
ncbi:DUF4384 domain-containing protein [bacterium]|nr:DUF4384 domain-containing protein [bacterium]